MKETFFRFVALTLVQERGCICYDIIMAYRHDMLHAGLSVVEVRRGKEQRYAKSCGEWNHLLSRFFSNFVSEIRMKKSIHKAQLDLLEREGIESECLRSTCLNITGKRQRICRSV